MDDHVARSTAMQEATPDVGDACIAARKHQPRVSREPLVKTRRKVVEGVDDETAREQHPNHSAADEPRRPTHDCSAYRLGVGVWCPERDGSGER